jgi:arylformamidase
MIKSKCGSNSNWIDVSVPLQNDMVVWPGMINLQLEHRLPKGRDGGGTITRIRMEAHTGTRLDAPQHFFAGRTTIDQMPLDAAIGPARVIEITDHKAIKPEELKRHNIRRGEKILFKTLNSQRCWQTNNFFTDYVYISREAASFLVDMGVSLVGIDYLSVDSPTPGDQNQPDTHQTLLGAEIWILEGLDLSSVSHGNYNLICLPLKLVKSDGSPVRAVLQPIS